ncbi:breakpoint cluster region protein-like [Osmerus eperlanus]|uniref:breakpoint cluster region protein-like n=1 Tax=Osmerus eperlanus TaxID=29151 RepID=UPI002E13707D
MWEQEEFEKHWRNEFPNGEVPQMDLKSVDDIEAELEKCKANLKTLQQALSEEKFKVIYLQTTLARQKKSYDEERWHRKDENLNIDTAKKENEQKSLRTNDKVDRASMRAFDSTKQQAPGSKGSTDQDNVISPVVREMSRISTRTGKPVPVPPRKPSFQKGDIALPAVPPQVGNSVGKPSPSDDIGDASDREYEDGELNENFVKSNLVTPKTNPRESQRTNLHRDALRPFRMSRDFDSSDEGRLSPSCMQTFGKASRGSGCSTPERRSDGYLSSDHEDSSSVSPAQQPPAVSRTFSGLIRPGVLDPSRQRHRRRMAGDPSPGG